MKLKIDSHIKLLKFLKQTKSNISKIDEFYNEVELGDKTNREAYEANEYFNIVFGNDFKRRDDSELNNQIINSFLNYGYSILLSIVSRAIVKAGLDTRIALFHKSFSNHYALACDLMEPFRTIVDV
ncbi:MAG: type II CRISPR-associated endonuclease Cas1, partial [Bacteroidales bacterium]|nr:type II CRISPR-associated endonuclease Cas1 [Bacteroidales bacterium]